MSAENLELIRRGYEAFGRGDIGTVLGVLDPNIHWHIPGQKTQELAAGTFAIQVDDLLAGAQRVAVLCTVSAQRHGQHWGSYRGPRLARSERTGRGIPRIPGRPASRRRVLVAVDA